MSGSYSHGKPVGRGSEPAQAGEGPRGHSAVAVVALVGGAMAWFVLIYLAIELGSPGTGNWTGPAWGAYSALLFAAPALTFLPVGQAMGSRFLPVRAGVVIGAFGFLLTFVDPATVFGGGNLAVAVFAVVLFAVLAVVVTPVAYALGPRLFGANVQERRLWAARREGVLGAAAVALGVGMSSLGVLNWAVWAFLVVVAAAVRALFLARQARS